MFKLHQHPLFTRREPLSPDVRLRIAPGLWATGREAGTLTWDQALFSFRFENCIPPGKAKRKESLMQTLYETCTAHVFEWLTFAESANQNYFRCFFF